MIFLWSLILSEFCYCETSHLSRAGAEIPLSRQALHSPLNLSSRENWIELQEVNLWIFKETRVRSSSFLKYTCIDLEGTLNNISWWSGSLLWFYFIFHLFCLFFPSYFFRICNFTVNGLAANRSSSKRGTQWTCAHGVWCTVPHGLAQAKNGSGPSFTL